MVLFLSYLKLIMKGHGKAVVAVCSAGASESAESGRKGGRGVDLASTWGATHTF